MDSDLVFLETTSAPVLLYLSIRDDLHRFLD